MQLNLNKKKFLSEENVAQIVKIGINFGERLNSIESEIIADYDNTKTYLKGESCYHNNYIYRCKATATGDWDFSRWELIGDEITELTKDDIKDMLGLSDEELETLSKIILDSEVRLDKTYSSSKIYTDIQNAIDTAKAYTLTELGKISGASYKIASSTSDMTDEKVIYLLQNGSNYDMYIVESGTPTKIGDTTIDLSDYYTKTEIDNDFLKKTDATSTYATITTVDGKIDKTNILSATSSTATDDILYSAKLINSELDKKANDNDVVKKNDITTTINSTSTDTQVPSAKAIFDRCIQGKRIDQSVIDTYGTEILKYPLGRWIISSDSIAEKFTDLPIKISGHIDITSISYNDDKNPWSNQYAYRVYSYVPYAGGNYVRKLESASTAGVITNDTGWKRVCTTSVADVPQTTITFTDTTNYKNADNGNAFSYYYVLDGICYLSIYLQCVSPVNISTRIECTSDIPKPKTSIRKIVTPWELTNYNVAPIFFCLENTSQSAFIVGGNVDTNYLLQFSYPVRES